MKKKLVALLLVAIMTIAATVIPASAAGNYGVLDYKAIKDANVYVNSYDNLTLFVKGEDGSDGLVPVDNVEDVYGFIVFCTADTTADIRLVVNAEKTSTWGTQGEQNFGPYTYDGGIYFYVLDKKSPFVKGEGWSQYVIADWSNNPGTIVGTALLDKSGNYVGTTVGTIPATSPVAGKSLPKTGVVSAAVLYALGSVLVGAGVVVTKKSRKED